MFDDFSRMVDSNVFFVRKFCRDEFVLDKIDLEFLFWSLGMVILGGWCIGMRENGSDLCVEVGDILVIKFGFGVKWVEKFVMYLLLNENFRLW